MAVRMGLFGVAGNHKQEDISSLPEPARSAHLYAAWGSFNWITHMSLFYHKPGLQCPNAPPRLPIPDAKRITNQSPIVQAQVRRLNLILRIWEECSGVFPCICQCWSISPELALLYRHKGPLKGDRRTFCLAELKFRELLGWSNRLPRRLCRNDQSPHYVQILQYEPPLSVAQRRPLWRTRVSHQLRQLKQLMINYRLHFASSPYTIWWHTAMTYLANAILQKPKEENCFFYFLLCVYGYERLRPCWRVTQAIPTALI
ncbi:uncharacterized protein TRIREDRAFT_112540 [Trichoderma reesei QM6a]|uniref:Predicted protein n=2 Tax=Hypocrea jecorina TaxID=51453 RepID=G0RXB8_HYPJQ|nr:uncharacterized protein TRIREDRAFT_112540 [Trichoderma reesei QM6a]EGR44159.1 predicted protein [Trichoderma reesei QM6a]ETR96794.1 hypothetical protein M419DRAFT_93260 [Trichoderma reesei RUT C-30]